MFNLLKKNIQIFSGLIFLLYFLFTILNSIEINNSVLYSTLLTMIIYILTVGEFLYFYNKNGKPRLQDWMRLSIFFTLILNYMQLVNNNEGLPTIKFATSTLSLNDSFFTMIVIIFALLSLDLAYVISNTLKKRKDYQVNINYIINRKNQVFYLLIVTTIFQSYLLFSGISGFGSTEVSTSGGISFIRLLSNYLTPFTLILSAYIIFIENIDNKQYKTIFYFCLSIQIITGFLSGMKENALEPILYTMIVFLISGRNLSRKMILIATLILILIYPLNNAYRTVISNPYLNTNSSLLNMGVAVKTILTKPISETLLGGVESYGERSSMFPFLLYAIENEDKWNEYKNMTRYLSIPVNWIVPRAIWADKPSADIGRIFYAQITGNRTTTSVTPTNIGWAYFEGSVLYIFIIFVLLGLIFEFIDNRNLKNPIILLFYVTLFQLAIKPEWDPYFMLSSLVQIFIIYLLLLKFIGTKRITT